MSSSFQHSCDSYACDLSINSPTASYKFIPQFELCIKTKEIKRNLDKNEYHYCNDCYNYIIVHKNKSSYNGQKRIFAYWDKDDYGFAYNTNCDFCCVKSTKLQIRLAHFKTKCSELGIRTDFDVPISLCNDCNKINPKQVFINPL
jgi:hypothetical protein